MSEEKERSMEVGVSIKVYCDKHKAQARAVRANETFMANSMMSAMFDKMVEECEAKIKEAGLADIVGAMRERAESGVPACCYIGQDAFDAILGDAPPTSGDEDQDKIDAAYAVPNVRPLDDEELRDAPEEVRESVEKFRAEKKK